jgi:hypothetical protein
LTRLRVDPATRVDAQRRTTQGKTTKDFRRCLKRSIAVSRSPLLKAGLQHAQRARLDIDGM